MEKHSDCADGSHDTPTVDPEDSLFQLLMHSDYLSRHHLRGAIAAMHWQSRKLLHEGHEVERGCGMPASLAIGLIRIWIPCAVHAHPQQPNILTGSGPACLGAPYLGIARAPVGRRNRHARRNDARLTAAGGRATPRSKLSLHFAALTTTFTTLPLLCFSPCSRLLLSHIMTRPERDAQTSNANTKHKNGPPQLMLSSLSSFGGPAEADKKARRRLPRITDGNPDLCPQIMVMQLEGTGMHPLMPASNEQTQRSGSWNTLMSALGPSSAGSRTGTPALSQAPRLEADDDTAVAADRSRRWLRDGHGAADMHARRTAFPAPRSPLSSGSSDMSLSPEPMSGHHSDPVDYAPTARQASFRGSLGLTDVRRPAIVPSYLRPHHDTHVPNVGQATPLNLSLSGPPTPPTPGPADEALGLPLWSSHRKSFGVDETAAHRRNARGSSRETNTKSYRPPATYHTAASYVRDIAPKSQAASPSASPPPSQASAGLSTSDSDFASPPASGRRSFFDTVLCPSTAQDPKEEKDEDAMDIDVPPPFNVPRGHSAPAPSAGNRDSLIVRVTANCKREYEMVPATRRPPRKERVSDHTVNPYACTHCTRRYPSEETRDAHQAKHRYPCDRCDRVLTDLSTLKAHKERHAGVRAFTCDRMWVSPDGGEEALCAKAFVTFGDLYQHMRESHGVVPKSKGEAVSMGKKR